MLNRLSDERSQRGDKITSSNTKLAVRKYGTVKLLYSGRRNAMSTSWLELCF